MEFSEKLSRLLTLTETTGANLAKEMRIDPSQVSRMRKGIRKRPASPEMLKEMAEFFASQCGSDYRRSALAELTGDTRILASRSERICADIISAWLSSDRRSPEEQVVRFLQRVDSFSMNGQQGSDAQTEDVASLRGEHKIVAFTDNQGKRQALLELMGLLLRDSGPSEVYIFTDESLDWLYEDSGFVHTLTDGIRALSEKGGRVYRIEPPALGLEATFRSIERWLPAYLRGAVRQYYYPHLRDELHRRTLFVAPGKAAVFSRSFDGENQSRLTIFCMDELLVEICYQEALVLLKRCLPMMRVHTVSEPDSMFQTLTRVAGISADGIYKTASLSIPTLPPEIMERICREDGSPLAKQMLNNQRERALLRAEILRENRIEDIVTLADTEDVLAGKVPIPSSKMLPGGLAYYTPKEYKLHLQSIIAVMESSYNYQVILTDNPLWKDVILYVKGKNNVLMIKDNNPFTVFEITEPRMAASFGDFLRQISAQERMDTNRTDTLRRLREAAARL